MKDFNIDPQRHHITAVALLLSTLSKRECEVLSKVCLGYDSVSTADIQQVSVTTVRAQRARLLKKIGAKNSVQLVYLFKSAEAYHLRRYIEQLRVEKNKPPMQLGVLSIVPNEGTDYQKIPAVTVGFAAEQQAAPRLITQREEPI
ncbi:MAG TPA: helix-turn-helix transcriptional regulator [Paenalcaligenes sp.]|nr:helix-turn-helix transcriptional regulator [Paenalcaligenes sp.]